MRILYLTPTYNSFSEVWQQRHIEMLSDYITYIVTISPNEKMWRNMIPIIDINPDKLYSIRFKKLMKIKVDNNTILSKQVKKLMKQVDIVFVQYISFALKFIDIFNQSKKNVFIHAHGFDVTWNLRYHINPSKNFHEENYVKKINEFNNNVIFIANSETTKQKLIEIGIDCHRVPVKYLGTEILQLAHREIKKSGTLHLLYLGRLIDFKGPELVIKSFELACDKGFNGVLKIAGDGPLRVTCELLRLRSRYVDKIFILGAVNKEKADELRLWADVFVAHNCIGQLSNQEEAFGVSIIEAMYTELPILTGKSGGIIETVVHGKTGLLNRPLDVEEQANNILFLDKNREVLHMMGEAAKNRVINNFSFDKEKKNLLNIIFQHSVKLKMKS